MSEVQATSQQEPRFDLQIERLGPLPLINHFIDRIGLEELLARHIASDARCSIPHARALGAYCCAPSSSSVSRSTASKRRCMGLLTLCSESLPMKCSICPMIGSDGPWTDCSMPIARRC